MKPKALVVEDDQRTVESIEDTLFSIGHEHDWATNQQDARRLLKKSEYDYVLLDIVIPARPKRGCADIKFGCNLLQDIHRMKNRSRTPVIVMGDRADCLDLMTELVASGASEFVAWSGEKILSCVPGRRCVVVSGTSGATAFFAGLVSLVLSTHTYNNVPPQTADAVRTIIQLHAEDRGQQAKDA